MGDSARAWSLIGRIVAVVAAFFGIGAAVEMRSLQSVSGNTVAEAFYNSFGSWALVMLILVLLVIMFAAGRLVIQLEQNAIAKRQQLLLTVLSESQRVMDPVKRAAYIKRSLWSEGASVGGDVGRSLRPRSEANEVNAGAPIGGSPTGG